MPWVRCWWLRAYPAFLASGVWAARTVFEAREERRGVNFIHFFGAGLRGHCTDQDEDLSGALRASILQQRDLAEEAAFHCR